MFTVVAGERASGPLGVGRFTDVRWVPETASTNDDLIRLAEDAAPEGIVLVTDHQTAGKGRLGRTWSAPPGSSLLASVLLRPPSTVAGLVTMAAAVAMAEAVSDVAGVAARVKWPNDLVWPGDGSAADRKLAGILAEAAWPPGANIAAGWREPAPSDRVVVVVGTGVNVNWPSEPPLELSEIAVALNHLAGREIDRRDLLAAYLGRLEEVYGPLVEQRQPEIVLARWRSASATLGRFVRVDLGSEVVEGRAVDVTVDGRLEVEHASGTRRVLATGDVIHLRQ
jgi:BirA family transcriptional regulator, biotin operon repressor / biotin---[acetyl-CoA-carboxylase] ligase